MIRNIALHPRGGTVTGSDPKQSQTVVLCPQCNYPIPTDSKVCLECGVDIALYALLAEKAYLEGLPDSAPIRATPASIVPRIGEFLVNQRLISAEDLDKALNTQKENAAKGEHHLLGQTLIQLGFVDRKVLDKAITEQIIQLHAALQESNRTLERRVHERTVELRRALERLSEVNQIKANLISNISHELRTPLSHIKGYLELLLQDQIGEISEEQRKALDVIWRSSERLSTMIEDLIEFSTASREGLSMTLAQLNLKELAADVLHRSEEKAGKVDVALENAVEKDLPTVFGDLDRLFWVLFQLIDNAIKFTPSGGTVQLSAKQENQLIEISVIDTGIGIPKDRIEEIFEPFHQLDGSPTRRYGGAGLGLALARLIINAHGSELKVRSKEGEGSTFSFSLAPAVQSK
jgi:signal transduction histidine kinase